MTEKELKRLSRSELLELLLIQTKERELLEERLEEAERKLEDRQIRMEKAGDIAQAALSINGVMEAAQAAARQYLESIERMERETRQRCAQMQSNASRKSGQHGKAKKAGKKQ